MLMPGDVGGRMGGLGSGRQRTGMGGGRKSNREVKDRREPARDEDIVSSQSRIPSRPELRGDH